jgi:hypothetical protein
MFPSLLPFSLTPYFSWVIAGTHATSTVSNGFRDAHLQSARNICVARVTPSFPKLRSTPTVTTITVGVTTISAL